MEVSDIKSIIQAFDESKAMRVKISDGDFSITLDKRECNTNQISDMLLERISKLRPDESTFVNKVCDVKEFKSAPDLPGKATDDSDLRQDLSDLDEVVKAPLVGVFYAAPSADASSYVNVGSHVKKGQVLCLIEAMKMMNEITSPKDGVIKEILVKNQDVVGFDSPLFVIGDN